LPRFRLLPILTLLGPLLGALLPGVAFAQAMDDPGAPLFAPGLTAPRGDFGTGSGAPPPVIPFSPHEDPAAGFPLSGERHKLVLEARLLEGGPAIGEGLAWLVFGARPGPNGNLPRVAKSEGGTVAIDLPAGAYLVHAAFGRAGATKRITIGNADHTESLVLDAGGLKLDAVVGDDQRIAAERISFEVMQENADGELVTIVPKTEPGKIVRLNAGTYHVISRYGTVNSIVRADIEVEPGKLTEAVMRHTGAEVTLKLVSQEGGEAIADTSWAVIAQEGTTLQESIGAFPSLVLAEGTYSAVATHKGQIYSRDFTVEAGVNRDIEVRLTDLVQPDPDVPPNAGMPPAGSPAPTALPPKS
jgi:hypothetical protein